MLPSNDAPARNDGADTRRTGLARLGGRDFKQGSSSKTSPSRAARTGKAPRRKGKRRTACGQLQRADSTCVVKRCVRTSATTGHARTRCAEGVAALSLRSTASRVACLVQVNSDKTHVERNRSAHSPSPT